MLKRIKTDAYEKGLLFKDNKLIRILEKGCYRFIDPFNRIRVTHMSVRDPWINHTDLDLIIKSGLIDTQATIIDLKDNERALVWMDNRFACVLGPGKYALWNSFMEIKVETVVTDPVILNHSENHVISKSSDVQNELDIIDVAEGFKGVFFKNGSFERIFEPGRYLVWKNTAKVKFYHVDMRERVIDISGQDIMTSDKVTLRLNAVLCYHVADALKSVSATEDSIQALYRETQLAVRAVVGTVEIDTLLSDKEQIAEALESSIKKRAADFGLEIISLGIRDIILPGEMKHLLNRVIEAKKAADANLITRREETAAMRSQANTAKLLESNPTLMRLRELDLLEKIACDSKMNIVLGEKGLADRIMNLL